MARLLLRAGGCRVVIDRGGAPPAELIAVAEIDAGAVDATSAWVADNLAVLDASLAHARSGAALTAADLRCWHSRLVAMGPCRGRWSAGTVGFGNGIGGASPRQAAYVPPPPEHGGRLIADLVRAINTAKLDPINLAAVIHAQFSRPSTPPATVTASWAECSSAGS